MKQQAISIQKFYFSYFR